MFGFDSLTDITKDEIDTFTSREKEKTALMRAVLNPWSLIKNKKSEHKTQTEERSDMGNKKGKDVEDVYNKIAILKQVEFFIGKEKNRWKFCSLTDQKKSEIVCVFGTYNPLVLGFTIELKNALVGRQMDLIFEECDGQNEKKIKVIKPECITTADIETLLDCPYNWNLHCHYKEQEIFHLFYYFGEKNPNDEKGGNELDKYKIPFEPGKTAIIDKICKGDYAGNFVILRAVLNGWVGVVKKEEDLTVEEKAVVTLVRKEIKKEEIFHKKAVELSKKVKKVFEIEIGYGDKEVVFRIDDDKYREKNYFLKKHSANHYQGKIISTLDGRAVAIAAEKNDEEIFNFKKLEW